MNSAHLHLLINHIPVLAMLFSLLLLLYGLIRDSGEVKRAALGGIVLAALTAVPSYFSGEAAQTRVEAMPVTDAQVEMHEEAAETAVVFTGLAGAIALVGLWAGRRSERLPRWTIILTLLLALGATALLARTANLGGQIRHTEIRPVP